MNLSGWHSRRIALGTVVMTCLCLLILGLAPLWNTAHASTLTYMLTDLGSWSVPVQLPGSCGSSVAVNHVGLMAAGGTFTAADGTRHVEVCTLAILTRVRPKDQRADYTAGDFVTPMTRRCAKLGYNLQVDHQREKQRASW